MIRGILMITLTSLLIACASSSEKVADSTQQDEMKQYMQKLDLKLTELQAELGKTSSNVADLKQVIDETIKKNQPPAPPSVTEVGLDDDHVMGSKSASVAIVEFSDFQCPYCAAFHEQYFPIIKQDYIDSGKVKFIYRDLALDFHPEAENAAIAANCAGGQNAYYAMHDLLFKNQPELSTALYSKLAKQLNLNLDEFEQCYKGKIQKQEVRNDLDYARKIGISGTPAFFIGRIENNNIVDVKYMEGAQTPLAFSRIIDGFLEKSEGVVNTDSDLSSHKPQLSSN